MRRPEFHFALQHFLWNHAAIGRQSFVGPRGVLKDELTYIGAMAASVDVALILLFRVETTRLNKREPHFVIADRTKGEIECRFH